MNPLSIKRNIAALSAGVPFRLIIDGLLYERLTGADGSYLIGADGRPLYGRVA